MKQSKVLIILLILISCSKKAPKVELNLANVNKAGHREFTIKNIGTSQLLIEGFSTSCDCTNLKLESNTKIEAGDSLNIQILLKNDSITTVNMRQVYITLKTNATPRLNSFDIIY